MVLFCKAWWSMTPTTLSALIAGFFRMQPKECNMDKVRRRHKQHIMLQKIFFVLLTIWVVCWWSTFVFLVASEHRLVWVTTSLWPNVPLRRRRVMGHRSEMQATARALLLYLVVWKGDMFDPAEKMGIMCNGGWFIHCCLLSLETQRPRTSNSRPVPRDNGGLAIWLKILHCLSRGTKCDYRTLDNFQVFYVMRHRHVCRYPVFDL